MFLDPVFWLVTGVGAVLSMWAGARVKSTFAKFSQVRTRRGVSGADIAQRILDDAGISDVSIEPVRGALSDHYDPRSKTLRLSEPVYGSTSISAIGVAAHEVGHAIQHNVGYAPLKFRSAWVPMAGIGTNIGFVVMLAGLMTGSVNIKWIGVALFSAATVFTLITLPVEFDASKRALNHLRDHRYLDDQEMEGATKVLNAAAMTYVAAFIASLLTLLYWLFRLGLLGGSDD